MNYNQTQVGASLKNSAIQIQKEQPERRPFIECEMDDLEGSISTIEEDLNKLFNKLEQVMQPADPVQTKDVLKETSSPMPPLAIRIKQSRMTIQRLSSDLREITNRVEL